MTTTDRVKTRATQSAKYLLAPPRARTRVFWFYYCCYDVSYNDDGEMWKKKKKNFKTVIRKTIRDLTRRVRGEKNKWNESRARRRIDTRSRRGRSVWTFLRPQACGGVLACVHWGDSEPRGGKRRRGRSVEQQLCDWTACTERLSAGGGGGGARAPLSATIPPPPRSKECARATVRRRCSKSRLAHPRTLGLAWRCELDNNNYYWVITR